MAKFRLELAESGTIQQNSGKILPESQHVIFTTSKNTGVIPTLLTFFPVSFAQGFQKNLHLLMDNETAILALATLHLKAAEELFHIQQFHQALYLAGYAVELTLKARIVRLLNLPDLYSGKYENEIIKIYRTHDFKRLVLLSGLKTQLDTFTAGDPVLANH